MKKKGYKLNKKNHNNYIKELARGPFLSRPAYSIKRSLSGPNIYLLVKKKFFVLFLR